MDFSERIATAPAQSLAGYNRTKGSRMWARANEIPSATGAMQYSSSNHIERAIRRFDQFLIC
jgi:hypothetical protein